MPLLVQAPQDLARIAIRDPIPTEPIRHLLLVPALCLLHSCVLPGPALDRIAGSYDGDHIDLEWVVLLEEDHALIERVVLDVDGEATVTAVEILITLDEGVVQQRRVLPSPGGTHEEVRGLRVDPGLVHLEVLVIPSDGSDSYKIADMTTTVH
ncbi:hypothetical protein [Engelhardtia mirabilis]|uniref:Uncharacterized protein n=1 Tax=Engelhardtia mirabilis TaxID=2528011 RepID=A0A518BF97_9BACT|nr:hypothetical protein Pla133_06970 [Planctomycetes bacterium Pla133]QDU99957.1 hypothetical protein Pla86_06960 [Planctomycetes bacterium Pla86]